MMTENALLNFTGLPEFDKITFQMITPAIDSLLQEAHKTISDITQQRDDPTWVNTVEPLTNTTERLSRAWGTVNHLNSVLNTPELREIYNQNLPKVSLFWSEMGQNLALYQRLNSIALHEDYQFFSSAQKQAIDHAVRDFQLSGAELDDMKKMRFSEIQTQLAALGAQFEQNVMDATDSYALYIETLQELAGVPEDSIEMFAQAAKEDGRSGYKVTLQIPYYLPVIQYADNRELREKLYKAYVTRASEYGNEALDNGPIIKARLPLLREAATLLGFNSYAQVSLSTKMASSPEEVIDFLRNLSNRAQPFARRDIEDLKKFASESLGFDILHAWDIAYCSEKLRQDRYAFSDQEIKQYFPENRVLKGLFGLVQSLYEVQIESAKAPVWHPDVQYFSLSSAGKEIGGFYLDLYAREGKRGGAWMDEVRGRRLLESGEIQSPVAYLVCNFTRPVGDMPALFTHDEVMTLFHEFGHGLHHLLTEVDVLDVAGINGVEWDAVELPSQFMENFCWEWDIVKGMSAHVNTGEPLPRDIFDRLLAAKNFQSGLQTVRQIEFALFDMLLHDKFNPEDDYQSLLEDVRRETAVMPPPEYNRFANSFSHIFAGGYTAGYYSYKWAEVLSSDAYSAFGEEGGVNQHTGQRFRKEILAVGGSRPAIDSFLAFRGRQPSIEALLKDYGMIGYP